MEGRDFVRTATLDTFRQKPHFARKPPAEQSLASLYPPHPDSDHAWGMVIDLTACIGCNACISACQNENNTPIVGKREVARGRAMHWLRVDRYYQGHVEAPATYFEPVLCMQCELAPCEYVCPVGATVHDSEGLNAMVYNRCIGTRFCSQNCPYKVRRFNWFDYMGENAATPKALNNPDVTVRARGVMEKCTYCIQRISAARIQADREQRKLKPNEVRTACQAACPTQAIVFGDLHEKDSEVVRLKQTPLNYGLLEELNTRPRTTYLAQVSNPNPEIKNHE
jgi:molybdopterin-containing oxidoreductase family iron-sulfur binding subunit